MGGDTKVVQKALSSYYLSHNSFLEILIRHVKQSEEVRECEDKQIPIHQFFESKFNPLFKNNTKFAAAKKIRDRISHGDKTGAGSNSHGWKAITTVIDVECFQTAIEFVKFIEKFDEAFCTCILSESKNSFQPFNASLRGHIDGVPTMNAHQTKLMLLGLSIPPV